jgi:hypothetical protein
MSLELGVMPCLEEDLVIVFLMLHGGLGACVDTRLEDLGFRTKTLGLLMIAASCDILQVVLLWTELRRSVREPMCWVCPCDGCASDSGLSCDDVWSLVYSSGLS